MFLRRARATSKTTYERFYIFHLLECVMIFRNKDQMFFIYAECMKSIKFAHNQQSRKDKKNNY